MDYVPLPKTRLWKSKADFFKPFRQAANETIVPLYDAAAPRKEVEEPDLRNLNTALAALVDLFPDVQPEVFREMLVSVSDESRLQIVTEQLLTKNAKWIRGRYRVVEDLQGGTAHEQSGRKNHHAVGLQPDQVFRSDGYKKAVKQVLYQEFKSLSHSSIRAVLAEQNFSYTLARPVLQQLYARSWRWSFTSLLSKRSPSSAAAEHPSITWQLGGLGDAQLTPAVRCTGSSELDQELHELLVAPVVAKMKQSLLVQDHALAVEVNDAEAQETGDVFECECCYNCVAFERIAVCTEGDEQLCFDCVKRTVNEALYGQGWARTIDLNRSTVRCFAPSPHGCTGVITTSTLHRALSDGTNTDDLWREFQDRAASEALAKSRVPFQRCPSCPYVEMDDVPPLRIRYGTAALREICSGGSIIFNILLLSTCTAIFVFTVPVILVASTAWLVFRIFPPTKNALHASWSRVYKQRRGLKFQCQHPKCSQTSCIRCTARWKDPHICFENEKTSLRTAVEASATAAVKRSCPECLLSFVKASGCNKLVCNCGYTMCYVCRQGITSKEGYSHFCQHFRPRGGRCTECARCDLYGDEDEEAAIRSAVDVAEKAWRDREGGREGDQRTTRAMVDTLVGRARGGKKWEAWLDVAVDAMAA